MLSPLETGFALDRQWRWLRGDMDGSKRPALRELARCLAEAGTPYAVVGGIALQVHASEPRTTVDIDLVVRDRTALPWDRLSEAGFRRTGEFGQTVNLESADGIPVQIADDPLLAAAVDRPVTLELDGITLRVMNKEELVRAKMRAARSPARRRSKRTQDLADVLALLEQDASLEQVLTPEDEALLERAGA